MIGGTNMTDKEFLDSFIAERMQTHYSTHRGNMADGEPDISLQWEREYVQAVETLPTSVREAIENFVSRQNSKAASDETFFYMRGVKDGLLLYKLLAGL